MELKSSGVSCFKQEHQAAVSAQFIPCIKWWSTTANHTYVIAIFARLPGYGNDVGVVGIGRTPPFLPCSGVGTYLGGGGGAPATPGQKYKWQEHAQLSCRWGRECWHLMCNDDFTFGCASKLGWRRGEASPGLPTSWSAKDLKTQRHGTYRHPQLSLIATKVMQQLTVMERLGHKSIQAVTLQYLVESSIRGYKDSYIGCLQGYVNCVQSVKNLVRSWD